MTLILILAAFLAGWLLKAHYGSPGAIWRALVAVSQKVVGKHAP
jgi:hypothetical protein